MLAAPYLAEFGGSQKGQSLIYAYQSLAITTNTPGFEKLNTALINKSQKHIKKLEKLEIFVSRGFPPPYFEMYGC